MTDRYRLEHGQMNTHPEGEWVSVMDYEIERLLREQSQEWVGRLLQQLVDLREYIDGLPREIKEQI